MRHWEAGDTEAVQRWRVGEVTITKVPESMLEAGLAEADPENEGFLPYASCAELLQIDWLKPDFITGDGKIKLSFHALVVETPTRRILVDTCVGNLKSRPLYPFWDQHEFPFLESLTAAGFAREDIDTVVCTHLHVDHVGWNTMLVDGAWTPTFPNARYLFGRVEIERCEAAARAGDDGSALHPTGFMSDSVQPIFEAGLADLVEMDHRLCPEVTLCPTPGHTPGHVSVVIRSAGERALITGDVIHHPSQIAHPEWSVSADSDPAAAAETRARLLADVADEGALVIGTHWAGRTAGVVARHGPTYRLDQPGHRSA